MRPSIRPRASKVAEAIRSGSIDLPGGVVKTPDAELLVRGNGQAHVPAEFERLVLRSREDGTRVPVTPRMRAFLHARGFHLKPETTELFIPGRPFLAPAVRDFRDRKVAERLVADLVDATLTGKG